MNSLRVFFKIFFVVLFVSGITCALTARELPATNCPNNQMELTPGYINSKVKINTDKPLGVAFRKLDSLANAYSYFTNDQQPLVYSPVTNELITIKRGFNIATAPSNTLNDLFMKVSKDWGLTWGPAVELFSASSNPGSNARYPSIYGYQYDGKPAYVYTAPITDGNGWKGFINGLYYDNTSIPTIQGTMNIGGQAYGWGGTDSKIVGGIVGADPYGLAVSGLMPPGGAFANTSNIGMRYTTTFEDWTPSIPPQWAASVFVLPYAINTPNGPIIDSLRNSYIISLKKELSNNTLYFASYGRFVAVDTSRGVPAVSVSTDNGSSWSAFDIFPTSLVDQYASSKLINPSAVYIGSRDFVEFPNGDYSYIVTLNEDTTITETRYDNALHEIVELYKESGQFGIRFISKATGYAVRYAGVNSNNQMGIELMASRSVDGNYFMAKWVDFVDVQDTAGTVYKNATTDIFAAIRVKSSTTWATPKNLSESIDYDRITWIPDFIPNDLKNIPLLKLITIPNSGDTEAEARARQLSLENDPQYVMVTNFDGDILLSKDDAPEVGKFAIGNIYPNPAEEKVLVDMILPVNGQINFTLTDIFGRTVKNLHSQMANSGASAFELNLGNNPSGAYFLRVDFNGTQSTKLINIIK